MRRQFQEVKRPAIALHNYGALLTWNSSHLLPLEFLRGHNSLPAHGKTPCRIDETCRIGRERSSDRKEDSQLAWGLDSTEHEDTNDDECYNQGRWTTSRERCTGSHKETST